MSEFEETFWAKAEYTAGYRDHAEHFIIDRQAHLFILTSFFQQFIGPGKGARVLDLGCGDGILTAQLLAVDQTVQATALDGSGDMLAAAQRRLARFQKTRYLQRSFEDLIRNPATLKHYHLVMSAFAIHHLNLANKAALFQVIFDHLLPGGYFLNIDTVLPHEAAYTDWYFTLYREWIDARERRLKLPRSFNHIPDEARYNPDNKLSTLAAQLDSMKSIGFADVECHYKYGIFAIFSGRKPNSGKAHGNDKL